VVMLGDDDGLAPRYFSTLLTAFETHPRPEFVYIGAYFFSYPGAMADEPNGFLRRDRNRVFRREEPFWLDTHRAEAIARGYLNFRMPVASNMQFSLISRRMIAELSADGPFFRSPFPDFYATPLLFLRSRRTLVLSLPLVIIGITPKSYGASHFGNRPSDGVAFLGNEIELGGSASRDFLPGTPYYDSWLLAMKALCAELAERRGLRPNYRRYRFLQVVHSYKKCYYDRAVPTSSLAPLRLRMSPYELAIHGIALPIAFTILRWVPSLLRGGIVAMLRRSLGQHSIAKDPFATQSYRDIVDVYAALEEKYGSRH
jgi:hypothetical protein